MNLEKSKLHDLIISCVALYFVGEPLYQEYMENKEQVGLFVNTLVVLFALFLGTLLTFVLIRSS